MKKILIVLLLILSGAFANAETTDYEQIYRELEVPDFSYIHNIELFRLTSPLYFKNIIIEPGYYLLTPREHEGNWYVLFKEQGQVKYIIPVYNREIVPFGFYDENLPKPKLTPSQKFHIKFLDFVGKYVRSSQRKPAPNTFLETTDLDNNFISIVIYWGDYRYYMVLRTIRL